MSTSSKKRGAPDAPALTTRGRAKKALKVVVKKSTQTILSLGGKKRVSSQKIVVPAIDVDAETSSAAETTDVDGDFPTSDDKALMDPEADDEEDIDDNAASDVDSERPATKKARYVKRTEVFLFAAIALSSSLTCFFSQTSFADNAIDGDEDGEADVDEVEELHMTLPGKKNVKKHLTRDLLKMFSERITVKFLIQSPDGVETSEECIGRWCFECR